MSYNAKTILQNDAFQKAHKKLRDRVIDEFKRTPLFNGEKHREQLYTQINYIDDIYAELERMVADEMRKLEKEGRTGRKTVQAL